MANNCSKSWATLNAEATKHPRWKDLPDDDFVFPEEIPVQLTYKGSRPNVNSFRGGQEYEHFYVVQPFSSERWYVEISFDENYAPVLPDSIRGKLIKRDRGEGANGTCEYGVDIIDPWAFGGQIFELEPGSVRRLLA